MASSGRGGNGICSAVVVRQPKLNAGQKKVGARSISSSAHAETDDLAELWHDVLLMAHAVKCGCSPAATRSRSAFRDALHWARGEPYATVLLREEG